MLSSCCESFSGKADVYLERTYTNVFVVEGSTRGGGGASVKELDAVGLDMGQAT